MLNWFRKNTDLLEPHNTGTVSPDSGVKHGDKTAALKKAGLDVSFPYGYCYPISQFVFYTEGGYDGDYDLKLIKSSELKFNFKGKRGQTTHWFCQHKTSGRIIDLTIEQFEKSWMAKENAPAVFISATNKTNVDRLRDSVVTELLKVRTPGY